MSEWFGFGIIRAVALNDSKELFIELESSNKIWEKFCLEVWQFDSTLYRLEGYSRLKVVWSNFGLHWEINNCLLGILKLPWFETFESWSKSASEKYLEFRLFFQNHSKIWQVSPGNSLALHSNFTWDLVAIEGILSEDKSKTRIL